MRYHTAVSLDVLDDHPGVLCGREGGFAPLTPAGARALITDLREHGYTHYPPCDHTRPDGRCAGHKD